jgi:Zn finger protein HypA/HybF involved in hydrogenase expression
MRCYRCGSEVYVTQHPGFHTVDCPKCGPDQRAVEIDEPLFPQQRELE